MPAWILENHASAPSSSPASLLSRRSVLASFFLLCIRAGASGESDRFFQFSSTEGDAWRKFRGPRGLRELSRGEESHAIAHGNAACPEYCFRKRCAANAQKDDFSGRGVLLRNRKRRQTKLISRDERKRDHQ